MANNYVALVPKEGKLNFVKFSMDADYTVAQQYAEDCLGAVETLKA